MNVLLKGLQQVVSFEDGSVSHLLQLQLPSGFAFSALVTDDVAQKILEAAQGPSSPLGVSAPPAGVREAQMPPRTENGAAVFGGNFDGQEEEAVEQESSVWEGKDGFAPSAAPRMGVGPGTPPTPHYAPPPGQQADEDGIKSI